MRIPALACIAGLAGLAGAGFTPTNAAAQSLSCGDTYTVKRGDTLNQIARKAYGPGASYVELYRANRGVIGPNPSIIEVGMALAIPCPGQTAGNAGAEKVAKPIADSSGEAAGSGDDKESPAPREVAKAPAGDSVMVNRIPYRFITGTDWAPFTDDEQAQGGMVTDIMRTALTTVLKKDEFRIDYVRDWSAHLEPLLSDVAYDFSIPWFKPNCDVIDRLGEDAQLRCRKLKFSDPLFEMITGYYVNASIAEMPKTHADLAGMKVCRAQGYATYMLEEFNVRPPAIEYVRPVLWRDCFEQLASGEVDLLYISTTAAEDLIAELNLSGQIAEVPELAYITTMHAVTSVNNPRADAQLEVVNQGIRNVREDGTWFSLVQRHLVAHARKTALN